MGVSSDMRSSRVRRQAAKKPNKERTVQVRFSDEELAALDAICSEKKMTRSAFLRSCVEKVQGGDVEPTYVVTRNADAERMASEAKSIGVNVNQIARALNAQSKSHPGSLSPGVLGECKTGLAEVRGELSKLTDEVDGLRTDFGKDVFRAMALLWPDVPEQLEELCDYWYAGERCSKAPLPQPRSPSTTAYSMRAACRCPIMKTASALGKSFSSATRRMMQTRSSPAGTLLCSFTPF